VGVVEMAPPQVGVNLHKPKNIGKMRLTWFMYLFYTEGAKGDEELSPMVRALQEIGS
jgi:hypothetical protein